MPIGSGDSPLPKDYAAQVEQQSTPLAPLEEQQSPSKPQPTVLSFNQNANQIALSHIPTATPNNPTEGASLSQRSVDTLSSSSGPRATQSAHKLAVSEKSTSIKNGIVAKYLRLIGNAFKTPIISTREFTKGSKISANYKTREKSRHDERPQLLEKIKITNPGLDESALEFYFGKEIYNDFHPIEGQHLSAPALSYAAKEINKNNKLSVYCCENNVININPNCPPGQKQGQENRIRTSIQGAIDEFAKANKDGSNNKSILNVQVNIGETHWIQIQYNKTTNTIYVIDPQGQADTRPGYCQAIRQTLKDFGTELEKRGEATSPKIINEESPPDNPSITKRPLQKEGWTCGAQCLRNVILASVVQDKCDTPQEGTSNLERMLNIHTFNPSKMYERSKRELNLQTLDPNDIISDTGAIGVLDVFKMIANTTASKFPEFVETSLFPQSKTASPSPTTPSTSAPEVVQPHPQQAASSVAVSPKENTQTTTQRATSQPAPALSAGLIESANVTNKMIKKSLKNMPENARFNFIKLMTGTAVDQYLRSNKLSKENVEAFVEELLKGFKMSSGSKKPIIDSMKAKAEEYTTANSSTKPSTQTATPSTSSPTNVETEDAPVIQATPPPPPPPRSLPPPPKELAGKIVEYSNSLKAVAQYDDLVSEEITNLFKDPTLRKYSEAQFTAFTKSVLIKLSGFERFNSVEKRNNEIGKIVAQWKLQHSK